MSGASSMGSGGNRGDGNCPGLVERACRSIVAADDGYDGAHVFAGDHPGRRYGPGETSEDILERRASVRSLIASVLLVVALLLMGFLLLGVDAAQQRHSERERGEDRNGGCQAGERQTRDWRHAETVYEGIVDGLGSARRGSARLGVARPGQARQGGFGPQEAGGRNRQPARSGSASTGGPAAVGPKPGGKEAESMDGMEAFEKHELNPLWWVLVIFLPLLTTAAMHWVAWK